MAVACARCGKPLEPGRSVPPLCLDCFLETTRLLCVPNKIRVDYCKYCGSIRYGHRWIPGGDHAEALEALLSRFLTEKVKPCLDIVEEYRVEYMRPQTTPSWRTVYSVVYSVRLNGVDELARQEYTIEIYLNPTICPMCKDARGGDYNVLLQVRGAPPEEIASSLERLFNTSDQVLGSLVDVVEKRNGVDLMLLDRGSASKILRELRKHYRVSVKITGEDVGVTSRGKMRRRTVISIHVARRRSRG